MPYMVISRRFITLYNNGNLESKLLYSSGIISYIHTSLTAFFISACYEYEYFYLQDHSTEVLHYDQFMSQRVNW